MRDPADVLALVQARCGGIFELMEVAEEEIALAIERSPLLRPQLWGSFPLLCPTPVLQEASPYIFRLHCRELLRRVAGDLDTRPATGAEMWRVLFETSLHAPLNALGMVMYGRTLKLAFGPEVMPQHLLEGVEVCESRMSATDEGSVRGALASLQRRLEAPERTLATRKSGRARQRPLEPLLAQAERDFEGEELSQGWIPGLFPPNTGPE